MIRRSVFLFVASVFSLMLGCVASVAEPEWVPYGNLLTCECEGNPLCLLARRKNGNCELLWAKSRAEADKWRPQANAAAASAACKQRNQPGFLIGGMCMDVGRDAMIEHEREIVEKTAKARADCASQYGRNFILHKTIIWKGKLEYECESSTDSDGDMITCDPGKCIDPGAMFGNQCRESPGCLGGTRVCGSPGCP